MERLEVIDKAQYLDNLEAKISLQDLYVGQELPRNRIPTLDARVLVIRRPRPTKAARSISEKLLMLSHFWKGRVTMTPFEYAMRVPSELEFLENLVASIKRRL